MDVGLMARVPQKNVIWRFEHPVQGQREFNNTQVRAEVTTSLGHGRDYEFSNLFGQRVKVVAREPL
jgi:hypothetical protein